MPRKSLTAMTVLHSGFLLEKHRNENKKDIDSLDGVHAEFKIRISSR